MSKVVEYIIGGIIAFLGIVPCIIWYKKIYKNE